jgi:phosphotriesterase-related protein
MANRVSNNSGPQSSTQPAPGEQTEAAVSTVLGPVPAAELGFTLCHEHILCDASVYWHRPAEASLRKLAEDPVQLGNVGLIWLDPFMNRDNCSMVDLDVSLEEIGEFRKLGGNTIVDVTPDSSLGRDPRALQIASRVSGLNVIAGCGHYVHLSHPASLASESLDAVAARLTSELQEGIDGTGVKPGIIGEIGTSDPLHVDEEKVLRAGAHAHLATGVPITLHIHPYAENKHAILEILEAEGVSPTRVVMGHMDNDLGDPRRSLEDVVAHHAELANKGCYIAYDCCGNDAYYPASGYSGYYARSSWLPSDRERAKALAMLIEAGYEDQLMISQDVCKKTQLLRYGGLGYAHVLRHFLKYLEEFGASKEASEKLVSANPQRMLAPSVVAHTPPEALAASAPQER